MNFYFILLLILKIVISHKLIRGNTFYFVFWRSSIIIYTSLTIGALLANIIWSTHYFSYDVSNFLVPFLDFFYFFLFLIFFLLVLGKYIPSVSDRYFSRTINILLIFSLIYSFLNAYFLIYGQNVSLLDLLFPFGALMKYIWVIGPLFAAFYWPKLGKHQKKVLYLSILFLILLNIPSGRRSLLIFIITFLTFWCWRTSWTKKIALVFLLGFLYSLITGYHTEFKHLTNTSLKLSERIEKILESDQSSVNFIDTAINRTLHKYIITEPVYNGLSKMEGVGWKPLKTAIYAPIPAAFLEEKPWPGSVDGHRFSSFEYIVNGIAFDTVWIMSEYPISLQFMWHGSFAIAFLSIMFSILAMAGLYHISIYLGDRLAILPLLAVYPGDYNYFQPELTKLIQLFSYIYIPGFFILFLLIFLKLFTGTGYSKNKNDFSTRLVDQ